MVPKKPSTHSFKTPTAEVTLITALVVVVDFEVDSGYSADLLLGANIEFDFEVDFDQCVKAGLTIDGEIDYEKSASLNMLGAQERA